MALRTEPSMTLQTEPSMTLPDLSAVELVDSVSGSACPVPVVDGVVGYSSSPTADWFWLALH